MRSSPTSISKQHICLYLKCPANTGCIGVYFKMLVSALLYNLIKHLI